MANKSRKKFFKQPHTLFSKYYSTNKNINNDYKDQNLGYYLAGLIEGDGYINLTKRNQVIIGITFNSKDRPLAEKLLSYLGQGSILTRKSNSVEMRFVAVVTIKKIVALINGKFRTPALWRGMSHEVGEKLSNSGDPLKLLAPSNNRKVVCGWFNQLYMVIIQKMIKREIGYRGSKSGLSTKPVKAQRVDGSWRNNLLLRLRCTLMGFERSYQIKVPSKQLSKVRFYSTLTANKTQINPWFLTGFSDGEACFIINIYKSNKHEAGWGARATFQIGLHKKDLPILNSIKDYFGVGNISIKANGCIFYVQAIKDLDVILNHFDKYPLITQKHADYLLFKMAINLIKEKAHLNSEGLRKLVAIRASLNWGLPSALEAAFPNTIPYPRPSVSDITIKDP